MRDFVACSNLFAVLLNHCDYVHGEYFCFLIVLTPHFGNLEVDSIAYFQEVLFQSIASNVLLVEYLNGLSHQLVAGVEVD